MNKDVFKNLSYGVYVVSTLNGEKSTGCIANSIMQITQDEVAISIHHDNFTNQCIEQTGRFAVSILGVDVEDNLIPMFGFTTGKEMDKFANFEKISINGIDVIKHSIGYLICDVVNKMETETHTVFLGKIVEGELLENQIPMTYAYYHAVKKGRSPKHAPTYNPDDDVKD